MPHKKVIDVDYTIAKAKTVRARYFPRLMDKQRA